MKVKDLTNIFEKFAPLSFQESYDNSGLIIGSNDDEIEKALLCVDITEEILDEAINLKANIIISHHPIVFSGLKKINGKSSVERIVIKAIKNSIAIYSAHTNLDNSDLGVNKYFCNLLSLNNVSILTPSPSNLYKLVFYTPKDHHKNVLAKVLEAGAGNIGEYDNCSFSSSGEGTFRALENANPFVGKKNEVHTESEIRTETIVPAHLKNQVISALLSNHPYEEVAYDIFKLENKNPKVGSGMIGELENRVELNEFLQSVKKIFKTGVIKYNKSKKTHIKRVAVCGGSGAFLKFDAINRKADIFITADVKYHDYFDVENKMIIADIGHFESEEHTINLFYDIIKDKFPNFAAEKTKIISNPINYL